MKLIGGVARGVIPGAVKHFLGEQHRKYVFHRTMSSIAEDPGRLTPTGRFDYSNLIYGWGNEGWSAQSGYLNACVAAAQAARGPILECGSGLSTLLLGVIGKATGATVWSLEHDPVWAEHVGTQLDRYGIDSVRMCLSPLQDYGSFHWYRPPLETLPTDFSLVVCDGPPGGTPGGRSGMLTIMGSRLQPGCVLLLDDAGRVEEQAIAAQWGRELGTTIRTLGGERPYIELRVPQLRLK